jgi:acyl carrier protein
MVCAVVAKVLGTSPEKIDVELPLSKLGLDSLMAMELATRVKKELQVDLPTVTLMSGPSVAQLSAALLERLGPWADGPSAVSDRQLAATAAGSGD